MTLQSHDPEQLDELALRALDLAGIFREMSRVIREEEIDGIALHARKPGDWFASLEQWAHEAKTKLDTLVVKQRGARRAAIAAEKT